MKKCVSCKCFFAALAFSLLAISAWAAIPAPPVNQNLGITDAVFNNLAEPQCRVCHEDPNVTGPVTNVNRHHVKVNDGSIIPDGTAAPNGVAGGIYECTTCHTLFFNPETLAFEFDVFRDCLACHQQIAGQASVHHLTATAQGGDCRACHGAFVNNIGDGHTIPTYAPSLVTPWPSGKPNAGPNGEGTCVFCHDTGTGTSTPGTDPDTGALVFRNDETHHSTGFILDATKCIWCHDTGGAPATSALSIRTCEGCHGISSLHNIQFDNVGDGITPSTEAAGFGHIGAQSDCNGCHGFSAAAASAPASGPIVPSVTLLSAYTVAQGKATAMTVTGKNFINYQQNPVTGELIEHSSQVQLTDALGIVYDLPVMNISFDTMQVNIPAYLNDGNYKLTAIKGPQQSNPAVVTVMSAAAITSAELGTDGLISIKGFGFSAAPPQVDNLGVFVGNQPAPVKSWSDTAILAEAGAAACGQTISVTSGFGTLSAQLTGNCTEVREPQRDRTLRKKARKLAKRSRVR